MASHKPRLDPGRAACGGDIAPAGVDDEAIATVATAGGGAGTRAGTGVRAVGIRGVTGVSRIVVAPVDFGAGVSVVPAFGNSLTGTLPSAARNASADWNLLLGSFAMAIMMISLNPGGKSPRNAIGVGGTSFKCAVISEYCESPLNGSLPVSISYRDTPKE